MQNEPNDDHLFAHQRIGLQLHPWFRALGNLIQVTEPAPESGTHETYDTYNVLNQLTGVSMPRGA